jgi:general secretion pathway protein B
VSLILDALKKLERDKAAGEPGVVVVKSVPWGERARTKPWLVLGAAALVAIVLGAAGMWLFTGAPARSPAPSEPAEPARAQPGSAVAAAPPAATTSATPASPRNALAPPPDRPLALPAPAAATTPEPSPKATRPPRAAPRADDLTLNAISQRDGRPVALINDHLVFEGDSFDGVRILRIGETEVEVEVDGKRRVLRF